MGCKIIEMQHWTDSALGHYLLEWEQQRCDEAVADIFGYHAVQLGLPQLQGCAATACRIVGWRCMQARPSPMQNRYKSKHCSASRQVSGAEQDLPRPGDDAVRPLW